MEKEIDMETKKHSIEKKMSKSLWITAGKQLVIKLIFSGTFTLTSCLAGKNQINPENRFTFCLSKQRTHSSTETGEALLTAGQTVPLNVLNDFPSLVFD